MAQLGTAVATLHTLSPVDHLPPFPMGSVLTQLTTGFLLPTNWSHAHT